MSTEQQDRNPAPEPEGQGQGQAQAQESAQEQTPGQQPVWGAAPEPAAKARWSGRKTIAAVAIAVGIAGAGGAAIYAATNNDSGTQRGGGPGGFGGPGGGGQGGRAGGPGGFGRGMEASLHGEFVVSDGNGGYLTELSQTGKVTAITSSSITAASEDGFTKTYTIDASTVVGGGQQAGKLSDIAKGDTVSILAKKNGDAANATTLIEGGQQPGAFPGRGGNRGNGPGAGVPGAPGNGAPPTT